MCKPGYYGHQCKRMCSPGLFGPGCARKCSCPSGIRCDAVTGECTKKCPAGYHGELCNQRKSVIFSLELAE